MPQPFSPLVAGIEYMLIIFDASILLNTTSLSIKSEKPGSAKVQIIIHLARSENV